MQKIQPYLTIVALCVAIFAATRRIPTDEQLSQAQVFTEIDALQKSLDEKSAKLDDQLTTVKTKLTKLETSSFQDTTTAEGEISDIKDRQLRDAANHLELLGRVSEIEKRIGMTRDDE